MDPKKKFVITALGAKEAAPLPQGNAAATRGGAGAKSSAAFSIWVSLVHYLMTTEKQQILPRIFPQSDQHPPIILPWGVLGASRCVLGLVVLGASWRCLGSVLGASWGSVGSSWNVLGALRGRLGASWEPALRGRLGASWEPFFYRNFMDFASKNQALNSLFLKFYRENQSFLLSNNFNTGTLLSATMASTWLHFSSKNLNQSQIDSRSTKKRARDAKSLHLN